MAIYQPVYISPDVRSGLGLGVVDATQDMTVSWHISGPSAMVAYSITIYENNAGSTQKYTTGKTTVPAVYGTDSTGAAQFFSATITAATLSGASITNGNEYKLVIQQWWGATDAESVTQTSASVFVTRDAPTLTISAIGTAGVIGTRYYTFTGNYAQAQGDVLNWFRWRIATQGNESEPFFDSGEVTGTMDISCTYDGFFSDGQYAIRLDAQTENGVEATTGWVNFSASYANDPTTGAVRAGCVGGTDAVLVEWSGVGYIPGEATGPYSISDDNVLTLPLLSSITWDQQGTGAMNFAEPWSIVWSFVPRGTTGGGSRTLLTLTMDNGDVITFRYSWGIAFLVMYVNGTSKQIVDQVSPGTNVTLTLTSSQLTVTCERMGGGLYPDAELYPAATLYPAADDTIVSTTRNYAITYTQDAIVSVTLGSPQVCNYLEIINSTSSKDYMLANWTDGINAGVVNIGGGELTGYALYRKQGDNAVLTKIAQTDDPSVDTVFDYGALSQQGPYTYYLFPVGSTTYIASALVSGTVMPCWWNWTLMECAATSGKNAFTVLAAYRFRYNVETGPMSNSNTPNILTNFTPYPRVQLAPQNYKSASLTGLIGAVSYASGQPEYIDTIAIRDAIYGLSTTQNALFLKSRKGDLIRIRISGAISMQTGDATREQMQTATIPWVEVGPAKGVTLYSYSFASAQEEQGEFVPQYYMDTSDATAGEANIRTAKTAYGPDGKIIGDAAVEISDGTLIMPDGMEEV